LSARRPVAEPLKNYLDERVPRAIAGQIIGVWPPFSGEPFLSDVLEGYHDLTLMDRGRHIARTLRRYLPESYPEALEILLRSVGDRPPRTEGNGGMASFLYLPHTQFVEEFGLDDFEGSMKALHVLTQRFTAEFSVRAFIERYEVQSLALLREWTQDPDPHVRRLVSEGTRPRLPWAARLRRFQKDPAPILPLLEQLRDDSEEFVRRSVANNLNDIGKDHPEVLLQTAKRWMSDANQERRALVRHALRTLVKQGNAQALEILGYGEAAAIEIREVKIGPDEVPKGHTVTIEFSVQSTSPRPQRLLVDLRVHYVKSNGSTSPKVFKLKTLDIPAGGTTSFKKRLSLADLTTRRHYAGRHRVEALINGTVETLGQFVVTGPVQAGALRGIKTAATPDSVRQDFDKAIPGIKGGSGN
jgi:3-methyladenine DNA glycosylase AlkC